MKVFLSGLEVTPKVAHMLVDDGVKMQYNLMSYYVVKGDAGREKARFIQENTREIMIDSGAHTFQKGTKVGFDEYVNRYADFIKWFDRPNVVGFFEMDIDNIVGYNKVLEYRKILKSVSNKIIPVWHKSRGIEEFKRMCQENTGGIIAVSGFKNEDIRDDQYLAFLRYAKSQGCKMHCLGMTRKAVLEKVPFDYCDSSSWKQGGVRGRISYYPQDGRKLSIKTTQTDANHVYEECYKSAMRMQKYYYMKWRRVCGD